MPLLRFQLSRGRGDRPRTLAGGLSARDRPPRGRTARPQPEQCLFRGRNAQPDGARPRCRPAGGDPRHLVRLEQFRGHARDQPHLGRGQPLPRLPRGRGQPRLGGAAGPRRRRSQAPRQAARYGRGAGRAGHGPCDLPEGQLRSDLCAPEPDIGRVGGRAFPRTHAGGGTSFALSADHRARHRLRRPACPRHAARPARRGPCRRHVFPHPGYLRGRRPAGL